LLDESQVYPGYAPVPASEADIQNSVPSATNPSSEPATSLKDLPMAGDCVAVPVAAPLTASPPASSHAAVQNTTEAPAAARLSGRNMHVPASVIKKIPISSAESSSPVGAPGRSGKGFPSRASPSSSAAHLDSASSSGTHLSLRTSAPELSDPAHPVHPPPALNAHAARIPRRNPSPQGVSCSTRSVCTHMVTESAIRNVPFCRPIASACCTGEFGHPSILLAYVYALSAHLIFGQCCLAVAQYESD